MENNNIIIDDEFKHLMPPLGEQAYESLEASILESGCRDALVLWEGILIDGHNRFEICSKHNLPFKTISMEFDTREDVLIWIINTQVGRRNLTPMQTTHFRGLHYRMKKKQVRNKDGINQHSQVSSHFENKPEYQRTAATVAEQYKVSQNTILRDAKASQTIDDIGSVSQEAKRLILSGEVKIDKKELESLTSADKEEIAGLAKSIENGTYEKAKAEVSAKDAAAEDYPAKDAASDDYSAKDSPTGQSLPGSSGIGQSDPTQTAIELVTGRAYRDLLGSLTDGETSQAKMALRHFIDMLEDVYLKM